MDEKYQNNNEIMSPELILSLINTYKSSKIKAGDPHLKSMLINEIKRKFKEDNITYK